MVESSKEWVQVLPQICPNINQQAFKVVAKLITRGPCSVVGDDSCKKYKNMEEMEESLDQDLSLIWGCTCKILGDRKKNPSELKRLCKEEWRGINE